MVDATAAQASAQASRQRELYSLLIPLKGERLLVPRMCVAEVIAFAETERARDADTPEWFLGTIEWSTRRIPVVSLDGPETEPRRAKRNRTRVVVFHALTNALPGGYYGLLTQGFPQLVRVNPDVLTLDREQPLPAHVPAVCRVRMIHEYPLVPDVDRLEAMIATLPAVG